MKDNHSAKDLWSQVFARLAESDLATLSDPNHDQTADEARMVAGLTNAGWKADFIQLVLERQRIEMTSAPVTSPGVNPLVEVHLARLSDDVEWAMDRLGMASHAKVALGVEPRGWAVASKINVVMTDESVVTVSAFLFRFCGLIARAFMRTVRLDPYGWSDIHFDRERAIDVFRRRPDLLQYWLKIYLSFATTGTHVNVPYQPSTPDEVAPFEDVARAMEVFVTAHEYGHHHYQHGRTLDADPHQEEFEADQFALRIGKVLDERRDMLPNPYLASGAGGVVMLLSLETVRAVEEALGLVAKLKSSSHPSISARIAKFDNIALLMPAEFTRLKSFRLAAERVMITVHDLIIPAVQQLSS
jgi:hypothetical protein